MPGALHIEAGDHMHLKRVVAEAGGMYEVTVALNLKALYGGGGCRLEARPFEAPGGLRLNMDVEAGILSEERIERIVGDIRDAIRRMNATDSFRVRVSVL